VAGWGRSPHGPLLAVPNVTAHPSTVTVLLYNGPLLCSFNVPIKGLKKKATVNEQESLEDCFFQLLLSLIRVPRKLFTKHLYLVDSTLLPCLCLLFARNMLNDGTHNNNVMFACKLGANIRSVESPRAKESFNCLPVVTNRKL